MMHHLVHGNCTGREGGEGRLSDKVAKCIRCHFVTAQCVDNGRHLACLPLCGGCHAALLGDEDWQRAALTALALMTGELE